ncbi:MAG TPA: SDR family oxidoreductase [Amycolatopsis sp.]|nr:SDR family oxidoreductase [Amycolatopsis sp.]
MSLRGKAILVTGAGSGIGAATAVQAAREGAHVALLGRRTGALAETLSAMGPEGYDDVLAIPTDVTDPQAVDEAATTVLERFGGVDGLVNNAGIGRFAPIGDADLKDLQYLFDLHVRGPVQLIQRCLPSLRERRGAIVNVSSVAGQLAAPNRSFYGLTKAAVNHLTRSLARELAPDVRVNAILPGPVDTPIYDRVDMPPDRMRAFRAELEAMTPLGRFGESHEVAGWICRLLDDSGAWVTGVELPIDGGRCA